MTTDISEQAEQEVAQIARQGGSGRPVFGYYVKSDGEVTFAVTSPMEKLHYLEEGWKHLPQYGAFDATTEYTANHPFETLFMYGGAKEMPVSQVIANGFHVWQPEIPGCNHPIDQNHKRHNQGCFANRRMVVFPQLRGSDAKAWTCTFCEAVRATEEGLKNHMAAVHREERGELRGGEAIASALLKGLQGGNAINNGETVVTNIDAAAQIIDILQGVGLNKAQVAALAKAGLIEEKNDGD